MIKSGVLDSSLSIKETKGKGRSVFAAKEFLKGSPVTEYAGNLVSRKVGNMSVLPYVFDLEINGKAMSIDASVDDGRPGRFINHLRTGTNLIPVLKEIEGTPSIIFFASKDISVGEELSYDYKDRSKRSLEIYKWL